ncbi:hypothetical protein AVEN_180558-1 [Araneus ventricosus]|uniref:Uncharacterized protein n=1 Tax=Araneus ventricosus TaxID=182803 RepID=A0A4Y2FI71_ARAVE|nr:hypothetical protein AVEN_180558-1 [Araneus ventricosus]
MDYGDHCDCITNLSSQCPLKLVPRASKPPSAFCHYSTDQCIHAQTLRWPGSRISVLGAEFIFLTKLKTVQFDLVCDKNHHLWVKRTHFDVVQKFEIYGHLSSVIFRPTTIQKRQICFQQPYSSLAKFGRLSNESNLIRLSRNSQNATLEVHPHFCVEAKKSKELTNQG